MHDPDGERGRVCQYYRLASAWHTQRAGWSRRLTATGRLALPLSLRPIVQERAAAGESLRALAREYGVSHECIRRTATPSQPLPCPGARRAVN